MSAVAANSVRWAATASATATRPRPARDDLSREEYAHRDLEARPPAKPSKHRVRPTVLREWDSFRGEKAREIAGVALLLADERFDGGDVCVVARPGRVCPRGRVQMASFGALSQLELLHRCGDR